MYKIKWTMSRNTIEKSDIDIYTVNYYISHFILILAGQLGYLKEEVSLISPQLILNGIMQLINLPLYVSCEL